MLFGKLFIRIKRKTVELSAVVPLYFMARFGLEQAPNPAKDRSNLQM